MEFSTKNTDLLVGGSYNGSLAFFDKRVGSTGGSLKPIQQTILEQSHHDPVYDAFWLASGKSGSETVSTSTDGRILWWDLKMLEHGPTESINLEQEFTIKGQTKTKILGGTSMDYNADYSFKFLVGTEQGYILCASRRKTAEISARYGVEQGKHYGPIYSIQRNKAHPKYFMTVGDWQAKIWCEELRYHPIMQTRYHQSYLTGGCWSETRPGLFFLTRMDGFLDVWDFYYRQNEVAYSQKISDSVLTSIQTQGSMAAIGDSNGTVSMLSLCRVLYEADKNEKDHMQNIFERETLREKNLSIAQTKQAKKVDPGAKKDGKDKIAEKLAKELEEIEDKFMAVVSEGDEAQL
jgi:dynein intermediate chain 2